MNNVQKELTRIGACQEAIEWAADFETLQQAWDACQNPDWMLWYLWGTDCGYNMAIEREIFNTPEIRARANIIRKHIRTIK